MNPWTGEDATLAEGGGAFAGRGTGFGLEDFEGCNTTVKEVVVSPALSRNLD
jgi:hypothetical protein